MSPKKIILSVMLIINILVFTNNIFACKVLVDLNTFKKANIDSILNLKCDGVWAILVNSDLTNNDWINVYKTLNSKWNVSEDNPGKHSDYDRIKLVAGRVDAAMCYNETYVPPVVGSTQGIGGTILSPTDINKQSATHGGNVIVLTRSYEQDGWSDAVDAALKNPLVTGVALECYPNRTPQYLDSLRVKKLITACLTQNKNFYFLSPGYTNYTSYMKGYINLLINEGIDFSDDRIYLVAASYDYIAPFIGGDESVEGVVKYYLSVKERFASANINAKLTITGTQNAGDRLNENSVLFDFQNGSQDWYKGGTNIDTVFSTSVGQSIPAFSGNYLWLETNATNLTINYRAAQVSNVSIDLSNNVLVGAVRTWGGLSADSTGFLLKVKVWGLNESDTISATHTIGSDNWTYFSFDASNWASAKNISGIWIGIAYNSTDTSVINWIGKAAIDQIGLNSISTTGVKSYFNNPDELKQNYPNPFTSSTSITIKLDKTEKINLDILDLSGRTIKNIAQRSLNSGFYNFSWNGTDDTGRMVTDGIYFYRLSTDNGQQIKKIILIR